MNSNWSYSPETPNLGQIQRFLEPCDLEIWWMTLKNNRAPLLCCFQLCAWFHCHMWIQTGVRVRKRLSWVLTSVTLTFDLWPWPLAWTSLLTMVITPENFMMIRWWEHGEKGVTDRRTDRQTDGQTDGRTDWTSHIQALTTPLARLPGIARNDHRATVFVGRSCPPNLYFENSGNKRFPASKSCLQHAKGAIDFES